MKKVVILGAGLTGLTLAWKLYQKFHNSIDITIIEAKQDIGGWIQTCRSSDMILDLGPKGFSSAGNGSYTLQLIKELQLEEELISANKTAHNKYIFSENKIKKLNKKHLFFRGLIPFILKDLFVQKHSQTDDSLHRFLSRHFSKKFLTNTLSPIITSIKAGNVDQLSAKETFPYFWDLEVKYGSLIKGLLKNKTSSIHQLFQKKTPTLFSLKEGLETLIHTLQQKTPATLLLSSPVTSININNKHTITVHTKNKQIEGDLCFYTLPLTLLPSLLSSKYDFIHKHIKYWNVSCMAFGWNSPFINPYHGYGMVIKKDEESQVLGIVWNSDIFPQQQPSPQTRLSVIFSGAPSQNEAYSVCSKALKKYLGISQKPHYVAYLQGEHSIPQLLPNFQITKSLLKQSLPQNFKIVGQNISGPGINNCIMSAFHTVSSL